MSVDQNPSQKPPFDHERYKWRKDESHAGRYKRQPAGGELIQDVWNFLKHGDQNLFIGVYATLSTPLASQELLRELRRAWVALRWEVPTVAAQVAHDPKEGGLPTTWMTYDVAQSAKDVEKWAEETIILREDVTDLDTLRYEIGQGIIPTGDLVPQTFLYLAPSSPTTFGVLLHTSHVPFDGAGIKVLMTKLFEHLALYISDPHHAEVQATTMRWGEEHANLLPVAGEILRKHEPAKLDEQGNVVVQELPAEPREGPAYEETLTTVMTGLATGGPKMHPFKSLIHPPFDPMSQKPKTRRAAHTFTVEESNKIVAATRLGPGEKFTVNHLLHGAVCLLPILDNPPPADSQAAVFFYGLVDSRQRLDASYRSPEGYAAYCLGMSPIVIPVSVASPPTSSTSTKDKILALTRAVREEYKAQAALPALLAIEAEQVDMMLTAPPPPPWCGPWYSADGRGSVYLRESYPKNHSGKSTIEITDFFVGLNKLDPGPFFRATEWKGRIRLSADYNELAVEPQVVDGWMKKWAELVLSVTE
ncbi:hypothetical protein BD410DRAFT_139736 [Rickenella mellea]|uniref:CoA-dependent acyltransferase n=1 Tax=Rickenella mellea TaxID=50990 RepID=A0A4Y7PJ66_9AGAM|nr:hypothetical protein BD410DRAFT_139736 [Rickenella mellea]